MPFNYEHTFIKKGKFIYAQNAQGIEHGERILRFVDNYVDFPKYFFHYLSGGHVAALHQHLNGKYFFRVDFKNFFYSISRNRVAAALHKSGYRRARTDAKWSCVRNPIANGINYALPIGFVQSSALATMVLMNTNVATVLNIASSKNVFVSVYLDDLIGSGVNKEEVESIYAMLIDACGTSGLTISDKKLVAPCSELQAFNCHLRNRHTSVTQDRIDEFYTAERNAISAGAFEAYCSSVSSLNPLPGVA